MSTTMPGTDCAPRPKLSQTTREKWTGPYAMYSKPSGKVPLSYRGVCNSVYVCAGTMLPVVVGARLLPLLMEKGGFITGQKGVDYYAEIHTTDLNAFCHSAGMPVVAYGSLLTVPLIWSGSWRSYVVVQRNIYLVYMAHYMTINWKVGLLTSAVYSVPLMLAQQSTKRIFSSLSPRGSLLQKNFHVFARIQLGLFGLMVLTAALTLQETIGHLLSGDVPSRPEGIINAMIYAIYFSVSHVVGRFQPGLGM